MTELCRYPIINTGLKNDLIIVVFYGNLTDVRKERSMKKLKLVGILAAVVLIGGVISIPLINNHTAYKVEKKLCETPLPEKTELIESILRAGKLTAVSYTHLRAHETDLVRSRGLGDVYKRQQGS